jgi:hypothetical protein
VAVERPLDVLDGTSEPIEIPTGTWCFTEVIVFARDQGVDPSAVWGSDVPDAPQPLIITLDNGDGTTSEWGIGLDNIEIEQSIYVDGTELLIGLTLDLFSDETAEEDMNDADTTPADGGFDSDDTGNSVGAGPDVYETENATADSSFVVQGADGFVNNDDTLLGAPSSDNDADAAAMQADASASGCGGCASKGSPSWMWLMALPIFARRRRTLRW